MTFVKASPNEYLVTGRNGQVVNRGVAASAWLWGSTHVLVPSTQQEAAFEMTQESKDNVPLRFKGLVIYRIVRPDVAATRFDFHGPAGLGQLNALVSRVCLGELRRLQVEAELLPERARQALRQEILPLEQVPEVARALARLFQGMQVSVYGQEPAVLASVQPLLDLVAGRLRDQFAAPKPKD